MVPGTDGRKMSRSSGNVVEMYAPDKRLKRSVMGFVTDSTTDEDPKDPNLPIFQIRDLMVGKEDSEAMAERARAGGLGYGDIKKDLLERIHDYFGEMRERRARFEARPSDVRDILADGAKRAKALAAPVLDHCRKAAGLGPR